MATLTEAAARTAAVTLRYARAAWRGATYPYRATARVVGRTTRRMGQAFREALTPELLSGGGVIDTDDWSYRRLTRSKRDLSELRQGRQLEIAHWLYTSNPVARRILELTRDFVMGDGAEVTTDDEKVQEVVDAFWHDQDNRLDFFADEIALELAKAGEVLIPAFVNEVDGSVKLGWLDPGDVVAVLTDPRNQRIPLAVKVQGGPGKDAVYLKVIREQDDPNLPGAGKLMPALADDRIVDPSVGTEPKPYAGACFLFQINKAPAATRGTSDLLPLADWLDALDSSVWNSLDRITFLNSFTWDVKVENASEGELKVLQDKTPPPKPGSVRFHNEKEEWTAVTPDLKMGDFSEGVRTHLNHVMGGAGLPSHWFGASDDVNRASAAEMSEPTLKRLTKRQGVMRYVLETLVRFAIDQAVLAGQLNEDAAILDREGNATAETVPAREAFTVLMPEISAKDSAKVATAARELVTALDVAIEAELLTTRTAREVFANLLTQMGAEIDLQQEAADIDAQHAEREKQEAEQAERDQADLRARMEAPPAPMNGHAKGPMKLPAPAMAGGEN